MTKKEAIKKAATHIESKTELAYDVAANTGQIFDNVSHMKWFLMEVAREIAPEAFNQ